MIEIKDKLKSFKFWLFVIIFLNGTIGLWFNKLSGSDWVELIKWIFPSYAIANVLNKYVLNRINKK